MPHDISLEGAYFRLRPVVPEDAAFIVDLRTDPKLSRYINETTGGVPAQRDWIEEYLTRTEDWYFIVEALHDGTRHGTIGIYNKEADLAEWGRWIIRRGSMAAIESVLLMYRVAFNQLGINALYSTTIAENTESVSFQDSSGSIRDPAGIAPVTVRNVVYPVIRHTMTRDRWPAAEARLAVLADRTARFLRRS